MAKHKTITDARQKLQLSHLESQRELLKDDVDLTELSFITQHLPAMRFDELVTDGHIERTIEGASTVTLTVDDTEGIIRNSGRLARSVDIKLDGLWFRLVKVQKNGPQVELTFESREVAILRTYNSKKVVAWGQTRRSQFIQSMVQEVKEFKIPFICPDLEALAFVSAGKAFNESIRAKNRLPGFGVKVKNQPQGVFDTAPPILNGVKAVFSLTIKGKTATKEQLDNIQQTLDVGTSMGANHKVLVSNVMTIIQESSGYNLKPSADPTTAFNQDSEGLYQQRPSQGWKGLRDIPLAAREYFRAAIDWDNTHPDIQLWELCQAVQHSGAPKAYAAWSSEAERIVTAFGSSGDTSGLNGNNSILPSTAADGSQWQFTRGHPTTTNAGVKKWEKEDSWTCMQRLANEVNWRVFEVSGTIYYTTDKQLFKSAPRASITEYQDGVNSLDFDLDIGKPTSSVTTTCFVDRWQAPPGSVIEVYDMGPINGRWLVTDIQRGIFDKLATITLKKPEARLPEPRQNTPTSLVAAFTQQTQQYVPTPGFQPQPGSKLPKGRALREAIFHDPRISFNPTSTTNAALERQDIAAGRINEIVLQFLLNFTNAGYDAQIYALKSDHESTTSEHRHSNHADGLAVDLSNYSSKNLAAAQDAMTWIRDHRLEVEQGGTKYTLELIGPDPALVYPFGAYDAPTLAQHLTHIHVGFDPYPDKNR